MTDEARELLYDRECPHDEEKGAIWTCPACVSAALLAARADERRKTIDMIGKMAYALTGEPLKTAAAGLPEPFPGAREMIVAVQEVAALIRTLVKEWE